MITLIKPLGARDWDEPNPPVSLKDSRGLAMIGLSAMPDVGLIAQVHKRMPDDIDVEIEHTGGSPVVRIRATADRIQAACKTLATALAESQRFLATAAGQAEAFADAEKMRRLRREVREAIDRAVWS